MNPVYMTVIPEPGQTHQDDEAGDCLRCCIASIYGFMDPTSIPNFAGFGKYLWFDELRKWLRETDHRDAAQTDLEGLAHIREQVEADDNIWPRHVVLTGPSPRGDFLHSVVGDMHGNVVHDPHPSGDGLAGEVEYIIVICAKYDPFPTEWEEEDD